jgi:hypothetical protein
VTAFVNTVINFGFHKLGENICWADLQWSDFQGSFSMLFAKRYRTSMYEDGILFSHKAF